MRKHVIADVKAHHHKQQIVGSLPHADCYNGELFGEVDERFKSHAWKACVG